MKYYTHIPLTEGLKDKILTLRSQFWSKAKLEPHITVVDPREILEGVAEADLCRVLKTAMSRISRFFVIAKGVGDFPNLGFFGNKDVIYIGIKKTDDILRLRSVVSESINGVLKPSTSEFKDYNPHITLLEDLDEEIRLGVWNMLKDKIFFERFICEKIILLRKDGSGQPWEIVDNFMLK